MGREHDHLLGPCPHCGGEVMFSGPFHETIWCPACMCSWIYSYCNGRENMAEKFNKRSMQFSVGAQSG